jgi:hypothetical protein
MTLVTALTVNYDIIMTLRVLQVAFSRVAGTDTGLAIAIAVSESNPEIVSSALLTGICFSALLFSAVPAMAQIGFYFIIGSVLQGGILRVFFSIPAMALMGDFNWFPYYEVRSCLYRLGLCRGGNRDGGRTTLMAEQQARYGDLYEARDEAAGPQPLAAGEVLADNEVLVWTMRASHLGATGRFRSGLGATGPRGASHRRSSMGASRAGGGLSRGPSTHDVEALAASGARAGDSISARVSALAATRVLGGDHPFTRGSQLARSSNLESTTRASAAPATALATRASAARPRAAVDAEVVDAPPEGSAVRRSGVRRSVSQNRESDVSDSHSLSTLTGAGEEE